MILAFDFLLGIWQSGQRNPVGIVLVRELAHELLVVIFCGRFIIEAGEERLFGGGKELHRRLLTLS